MPLDIFQTIHSSERFHRFTFGVSKMPLWARAVLAIPMVPGIILVALSILLLLVSILALFILTVPVYLLLKQLTGVKVTQAEVRSAGVRRVEATVRDV